MDLQVVTQIVMVNNESSVLISDGFMVESLNLLLLMYNYTKHRVWVLGLHCFYFLFFNSFLIICCKFVTNVGQEKGRLLFQFFGFGFALESWVHESTPVKMEIMGSRSVV